MNTALQLRPAATAPVRTAEARTAIAPTTAPIHAAAEAPMLPNPRLRLDPALGIVVLEFRGTSGLPARSLPTEHELAAYRAAAISGARRPGEERVAQPRSAGA